MGDTTLRPGFFMTANAWLDADGRHVWVAHDCTDERVVTMLPFPTWTAGADHVQPSVSCDGCGLHTTVPLGEPEPDGFCESRWEFDGRQCRLPAAHDGAHLNGTVMWASYSPGTRATGEGETHG